MSELTPAAYRDLLTAALSSPPDANTTEPDFRTLFTPSSHRLALDPDVTVVRGARGTGKTYWAKALTDPQLRDVAAASYMMPRLKRTEVVTAFGLEGGDEPAFPDRRVIKRLVELGTSAEDLWSAVVLMALGTPAIRRVGNWAERIRWVRDNPEEYGSALRKADRDTRERGQTLVLLFDALEHLHEKRRVADALLSGLFQVALELRLTTSTLRAKIFVRPDMYVSAPKQFADASKLGANATVLDWSRENLYGLLFHQLGNHTGPEAERFRMMTGQWHEKHEDDCVRYIAPVDLVADEQQQEQVFVTLAGPFMGTDRRKGHTYTWVPNHLQDGFGRVSPRTWLYALGRAAVRTGGKYASHPVPLHYDAIRDSLTEASELRVDELRDDISWAALAIAELEGGQVPMEPSVVHAYWRQGRLAERLRDALAEASKGSGPRDVDDPFSLVDELVDLGVMTRRTNGAIDLPDVYRLAFDIGRRGGVPRRPVG